MCVTAATMTRRRSTTRRRARAARGETTGPRATTGPHAKRAWVTDTTGSDQELPSIFVRTLDVVDDQHLDIARRRLQLQPKLLLHRGKEVQRIIH